MPVSPSPDDARRVYTIGHSTRLGDDFVALLRHYGIVILADIRTIPRSRHNPQFNPEELARVLPDEGIAYRHLAALGGLRRGLGAESPNMGWRNASFRAYADYMLTEPFRLGLEELLALSSRGLVAIMCAEAVPWRCHRSLVGDALVIREVEVLDIMDERHATLHHLTSFARVDGERITYPAEPD
ncbi:MAG TPA: DUF488 domain-containing protein [Chloroflexota bacterium]|nr:DUF488 domain-containing protein [Chloroflexota bacterium]